MLYRFSTKITFSSYLNEKQTNFKRLIPIPRGFVSYTLEMPLFVSEHSRLSLGWNLIDLLGEYLPISDE
jgi:hypothetical protein